MKYKLVNLTNNEFSYTAEVLAKIRLRAKVNSYVSDDELINYCKEAEGYLQQFTGYVLTANTYKLEGSVDCLEETQSPVIPLEVATCNDYVKLNTEFVAGVYTNDFLFNTVFNAVIGCVSLLINGCDCNSENFSDLFINLRRISLY